MGSPTCEKKVDPASNPTAFKLFGALFPVPPSISDIPTLLQDAREGNGNPTNYGNEERGLCYGANEHGRGEKVGVEGVTNAIVFRKVEEIVGESIAKKTRLDRVFACPRCDSTETKFCYYNNYNMNQPRHFCKKCQRYWTAGGTLRNVPIGSGRRRNKNQNQPQNRLQNRSQATSDDVGSPSLRDMSSVAFVSSGVAVSSTGPKRHLPPLAGPMHTRPPRYGVAPLHRYSYAESHVGVSEVSDMFMEDSSTCGSPLTAQQDVMKEKDVADSELKLVGATSQGKTSLDASLGQHQFRCSTIVWNPINGDLQTNMPWSNHVQVPMWWHPNLCWGGATFVRKMVESYVRTPILCKHPIEDPPFMTDCSDTEPIGTTKSFKIDDPVEVARRSIWAHHTSTITSTVGTLKVLQPKLSQTKTEDPSIQSHINPAALSRSISFHEIN